MACAGGIATIEYMLANELPRQSKEKGDYFASKLRERQSDIPVVRNIRYLGLMIGLELKTRVNAYVESLLEEGLIAMPAGKTVLRLLPPLTIEYKDIDHAVDILISTLKKDLKASSSDNDE